MTNFVPYRESGFTLIELVMTILLVAILAPTVAVVLMGPFQTFYTIRNHIRSYNIIEQTTDDLAMQLDKALAASIVVDAKGHTLRFRKVIEKGQLSLQGGPKIESRQLKIRLATRGTPPTYVYFPAYGHLGIQRLIQHENQLQFEDSTLWQKLPLAKNIRYELLSEIIEYHYDSTTLTLYRNGRIEPEGRPIHAVVGHLADCQFGWNPGEQLFSLALTVKSGDRIPYRFKQQVALY